MESIVNSHMKFYKEATEGNLNLSLKKQRIKILSGFADNIELVITFYKDLYGENNEYNRIVLCGINPGRKGAGKTGIPFLDFRSLSNIIPSINNDDYERSAQFLWSIINHFGVREFFDNVYLTNISWLGFIKKGKNLNYYKLEEHIKYEFIKGFVDEMDTVNPKVIIPLSKDVLRDLKELKRVFSKNWYIGKRLPHPNYCSFPSRTEKYRNEYIQVIDNYIKEII